MATTYSENLEHALAEPAVAPTKNSDRIGALDFVRGWALFGILLMNITGFGLSHAYYNPLNNGGYTGADLTAWHIIQVGFDGTQRGLFSLLFGAGIILLTTKLEERDPHHASDIYMRRNLWLIGFGMVNVWILLWPGDILYTYGITALFAYGFRKLAPRWLTAIALASLAVIVVHNYDGTQDQLASYEAAQSAQAIADAGGELSQEQSAAIASWAAAEAEHTLSPDVIEADIAAHRAGWRSTQEAIAPLAVWLQTTHLYYEFGDVFGMMLIGMALFKLGVLTLQRPLWLYLAMVAVGYGIGLPVNLMETRWIIDHNFSLLAFSQADVTMHVGRLAMTMGHLGVLLLLYRSGLFGWMRRAFAAVGQMALTNYLTHSVVCAIIFTGFGLFGALQRHELYYIWAIICAVQLVISPIWLKYYRFGPMEWVWRALTYWKKPGFRRAATA
ncbi:DUF418 domain-containing protein [Altererythrobacter sp. BO-6]|uniref:DUF418 domain-containing protein n=1 Tax=Altererythrobacter sp. BO-6 TaxID=2604537 RepID=UPI0013E149DF|nr:DUF418 domain-containing protein [Altererythrobacter sp. BO-6]QIG53063.1 DUF418 domain-containing protein [Altererythrobacter sp. BO-6]